MPQGGRPFLKERAGCIPCYLPCGQCPECQKKYYTAWATRGSRELSRWNSSVFVTLTYNDEPGNFPKNGSLSKRDVQLFLKRLKKKYNSRKSHPIRQIYCGEYGANGTKRPHYHLILFNCDFRDKKPHRVSEQGHNVFTSATLDELWGKGFCEFGYAEPSSIAYLFKYILKKKSRKEKLKPLIINREGKDYEVEHEFIESSRNPGIGAHLKRSPSLRKGYLIVDGVKQPIPKYYLEDLRVNDPDTFDYISNLKFDFMSKKPKETQKRQQQKENAQKKLTDTKRRL